MEHAAGKGASLALTGFPTAAAQPNDERSFKVLVSNISNDRTLGLPDGSTSSVPVAPGAYAIVAGGSQVFAIGSAAGAALERLAEDGNPDPFIAQLKKTNGVRQAGRFLHDEPFEVSVKRGERLVFAAMFAQSNDLFYAPDPKGIDLFDATGTPRTGNITDTITLWDAGTEVNEAPGGGANQAPRQGKADAGPVERGTVRPVNDGFAYPPAQEVLEVSVGAD